MTSFENARSAISREISPASANAAISVVVRRDRKSESQLLGRDQPRCVRLAERLDELLMAGIGQVVDRADGARRVDADPFRVALAHEVGQIVSRFEEVVGARFPDPVAADAERRPLDPVAAPVRIEYTLRPTNLLSIELFAYTAVPEWGNKKVRIPLEDDAVLTERGIEWLYPVNERILLIR